MGPRCVESVCIGVCEASGEKDKRLGRDQTWMMESVEPERKKLELGSTARAVTCWRCDVGVDTSRPVHIYTTY